MIALVVSLVLAAADEPTPAAPTPPAPTPPESAFARAKALVEDLDCAAAAPLLETLVAAPGPDQQAAMFMQGYCLALDGSNSAAAQRFREAWSLDPQAALPIDVEPKVKVLIEGALETYLNDQSRTAEAAFKQLAESVHLTLNESESHIADVVGGERVRFVVQLTDPHSAVRAMRIEFKQGADPEFYSLPIRAGRDGLWRGEIPGTYTRTPTGAIVVSWTITASDVHGRTLATIATREQPLAIYVAKGSAVADLPARERLPHAQRLMFAAVGLPAAATFSTTAASFGVVILASVASLPRDLIPGGEDPGRPLLINALILMSGLVPPLVGVAVLYLCAQVLLDDWQPLVPTILFGVVSLAIGLGGAVYATTLTDDNNPLVIGAGPLAAAGGAGLASVATGLAALVMVALDAPTYE